jgi:hypothetical protein
MSTSIRGGSPLSELVVLLIEARVQDVEGDLKIFEGDPDVVRECLSWLSNVREQLLMLTGTERVVAKVNNLIKEYRDLGAPHIQGVGSRALTGSKEPD